MQYREADLEPRKYHVSIETRPIAGNYAEVSWIRRACRDTRAPLDTEAFVKGALATHGVIGSVKHGFSEFIAVLAFGEDRTLRRVLRQTAQSAMIQQKKNWHNNGSFTPAFLQMDRISKLFFEPMQPSVPDMTALTETLEQPFRPDSGRSAAPTVVRPVHWPFSLRRSAPYSHRHAQAKTEQTLFVGACLRNSHTPDIREHTAAELVSQFWEDSFTNPFLGGLRKNGVAYSYVTNYSRESCTLYFGVFVSPSGVDVAREAVTSTLSSLPTTFELKMLKDRALVALSYAGPIERAIRDTTTRLAGGPDNGFFPMLEAVTSTDCMKVLQWPRYALVSETSEYV